MGLCIADSLIVNEGKIKPVDIMKRFIAWWYCGYNNAFKNDKFHNTSVGLGGNISASFDNFLECKDYNKLEATKAGDKYTSGNGSIMRNAAIPICFSYDLDEALEASDKQSRITHQGNEAADCCKLLTYIVWQILNGNSKGTLKDTLDNILCKDSEIFSKLKEESVKGLAMSEYKVNNPQSGKYENWNWKSQEFGYNESIQNFSKTYAGSYAMDNMAMSLHILYYTGSFKQAITIASKLRGDADSVASVVGQIAGAYYGLKGILSQWIKNLIQWDEKTIALRGYILSQIAKNKKNKK
jgi:ADP-ribosylglycohydrolase